MKAFYTKIMIVVAALFLTLQLCKAEVCEQCKKRINIIAAYVAARLRESSTVQGGCALITLVFGAAYDEQHILGYTFAAGAISAVLKLILPDQLAALKQKDDTKGGN